VIFKGYTLILIKYLLRLHTYVTFHSLVQNKKNIFYSNSNKKIYHYNCVTLEVHNTSKTKIRDFKLFFERERGRGDHPDRHPSGSATVKTIFIQILLKANTAPIIQESIISSDNSLTSVVLDVR
jgi:hypothetical protein